MHSREEIEARVRAVLVETFELDEARLVPTAKLYEELDLDSIDAIDLVVKLEVQTGFKLDEQELRAIRTVGDITDAVERKLRARAS